MYGKMILCIPIKVELKEILIFTASLVALLEQLLDTKNPHNEPDTLVREAAQGHTDVVRELLSKFPDEVIIMCFHSAPSFFWALIKLG